MGADVPALWLESPGAKRTLIYFHGNAMDTINFQAIFTCIPKKFADFGKNIESLGERSSKMKSRGSVLLSEFTMRARQKLSRDKLKETRGKPTYRAKDFSGVSSPSNEA
jgi:hypothetical protein